ncbi:MAG: hypothetical protein WC668_05145 [Patescibacteria group bacterium]|jgi:hypothetical protein
MIRNKNQESKPFTSQEVDEPIIDQEFGGESFLDDEAYEEKLSQYENSKKLEKLKKAIDEAKSLEDLRQAVSKTKGIQGSKDFFPPEYIVGKIAEAEKYLKDNLDKIVLGSISGAYETERKVLGEKTDLITRGRDLQLRQKVREIVKGLLAERYNRHREKFEEYKLQYLTQAVEHSFNISQLEKVVKKVQPIREGKDLYEGSDMEQALDLMMEHVKAPTLKGDGEHPDFLSLRGKDLEQKSEAAFKANAASLPEYAGIRQRAHDVLKSSIKENQVGEYISSTASSETGEGIIRRGWQKVKSWFKSK